MIKVSEIIFTHGQNLEKPISEKFNLPVPISVSFSVVEALLPA